MCGICFVYLCLDDLCLLQQLQQHPHNQLPACAACASTVSASQTASTFGPKASKRSQALQYTRTSIQDIYYSTQS